MSQEIKLTAGERAALDYLRDQEADNCGATGSAIAKAIGVSIRGVGRILDRLDRRNLVAFRDEGIGRRLTLAGARAIGRPF